MVCLVSVDTEDGRHQLFSRLAGIQAPLKLLLGQTLLVTYLDGTDNIGATAGTGTPCHLSEWYRSYAGTDTSFHLLVGTQPVASV